MEPIKLGVLFAKKVLTNLDAQAAMDGERYGPGALRSRQNLGYIYRPKQLSK
jgi:hypothetical protein